jgi:uncharacterized protein (DUF2062 family)
MVREMVGKPLDSMKCTAAHWLRQGISPRRLALTLALGFAIGCIPVVGIPTLICAALALALRLNQPAIQVANYIAMPLQLLLIVPFVRLGGWLFDAGPIRAAQIAALVRTPPYDLLSHLAGIFGHALMAWLLIAAPAVLLLTLGLTVLLRRVPALCPADAIGD